MKKMPCVVKDWVEGVIFAVVGLLIFGVGYMAGNAAGYDKAERQAIAAMDIIGESAEEVLAFCRFPIGGGVSPISEAIMNGFKKGACEQYRDLASDPRNIWSHAGNALVKLGGCNSASDQAHNRAKILNVWTQRIPHHENP